MELLFERFYECLGESMRRVSEGRDILDSSWNILQIEPCQMSFDISRSVRELFPVLPGLHDLSNSSVWGKKEEVH